MNNQRVVLKKNVTREDVDRLAVICGWVFHNLIPQTEKVPYEKIWITQDKQTGIHYIEDLLINIPYLFIEGKNQEETISKIQSSIDTYQREDIHELFRNAHNRDQYIYAIYVTGAGAPPELDPELMEYFKKILEHSEPDVRKAALFAMSFPGWREFKDVIRKVLRSDPDQGVRRFAGITFESLAKHYWQ